MFPVPILMDENGHAIEPETISAEINEFGYSYNDVVKGIIDKSRDLKENGQVFIECASQILSKFGMKRSGPFHENLDGVLHDCWNEVGADLVEIHNSILKSGLSRDRYLLGISKPEREELIDEIWKITKRLLPFTMGKTSYGLVGASKILFSVLPEIVLPVDNTEWLHVFKTVDLGDVLRHMVLDTQKWEAMTGKQLNDLGHSNGLTTLPSVYNVMAMHARPKVDEK